MQLRVAEHYITQFGELAKKNNTLILPANAGDVASMIATAMQIVGRTPLTLKVPRPRRLARS